MSDLPAAFESQETRGEYNRAVLRASIAYQVFVIRCQRRLTQAELGKICEMSQPEIARLEDLNGEMPTVQTLLKVASGLDCAVHVAFTDWPAFVQQTGVVISNEFPTPPNEGEDNA